MKYAIKTENLTRIYKIRGSRKEDARELVALKDINLEICPGELFGLLGPNGAGKTTLIKILTTLLAPTSGRASVADLDVTQQQGEVRRRINMVSGGETSGYGLLTVKENLWMFSQFYGIPSRIANQRIDDLLQVVGLEDRKNTKSSDLSTGLRQKMNIVRGFMTDPDVLFLDEPTLGLDVGASREVRQFIRSWVDEDPTRTLLLTTHYMVEADELCDRVAIINKGKVLACDTPTSLKRALQQDAIFKIEVSPLNDLGEKNFTELPGIRSIAHSAQDGYSVLEIILDQDEVLGSVLTALTQSNIHIINLEKREPTLEDVFVDLVGKSMAEVEQNDQGDQGKQ